MGILYFGDRLDQPQETGGRLLVDGDIFPAMSDYDRIAKIIRYLQEAQLEQPSLAELSDLVGLSPHHLHRLFSKWAGITPKDFLQCLTASKARELLKAGNSVLDTSLSVGLSGPSRLHDLCVSLEAATPGEIKSGGVGWEIVFGVGQSPFGSFLAAESPRGICHLSFFEKGDFQDTVSDLKRAWPGARFQRVDKLAQDLAPRLFGFEARPQDGTPLKALLRGTEFQVRVWQALLQIPRGQLRSYGRLAAEIGRASASRAVGNAVGKNALAYLIPCHRVIRETGVVGNYRWGRDRKRAIIAWENNMRDETC